MENVAVFVKVVETGSFSAAARRLGMPKTTVSAKVAGLEKRLGVQLIQRTTRKLRMTEAGEIYFRHCASAIREVELGEAALQSAKGKPSGLLKVTAPIGLAHGLLPRIVRAYTHKYPHTSVALIITNRTVDLIGEGVDLAIRSENQLKDSTLIARRFFESRSNLWASPKYLKTLGKLTHPRDLRNAQFVHHPTYKTVVITNGTSDFELRMTGRIQADDFVTVRDLILLGEGIAWLPNFAGKDALAAGKLVPVLPQWEPKDRGLFYFVYAGRQYALPKVEAFIQTALEDVRRTFPA